MFDLFSQRSRFLHKKKYYTILVLIICVGAFFRLYQLDGYMHYQLDQARDFRVISAAIEKGPSELPLQGPKAAGNVYIDSDGDGEKEDKTTLRLGPLFYYLEYLSALLFGDTPFGNIVLITLLSIATIPLFYVFLREYFNIRYALALTAILSFSLYFVTYSRFGWNPNLIPFFAILTAYFLLRVSGDEMDGRKRGFFLTGAASSFAFLSNMHFLAMTAFGLVCLLFILFTRPKVHVRYWLLAICAFLFLNTPLIINDYKTGGENYKAFLSSVTNSDEDRVTLVTKVKRNTLEHTEMAWVILTGDRGVSTPKISKDGSVRCDTNCADSGPKILAVLLAMLAGVVAVLKVVFTRKVSKRRRNFAIFVALWMIITYIAYLPLAFDFAPRFFLVHAPVMIVLCGFVIKFILDNCPKRSILFSTPRFGRRFLAIFALTVLLMINAYFVFSYFSELHTSQSDQAFRLDYSDRILGEKTRVTLGQVEKIVDDLMQDYVAHGEPIHLEAQAEYKRAFWERVENREEYIYKGVGDLRTIYREGRYYLVVRTQSDFESFFAKFSENFDVSETKNYGTLTLYKLKVREDLLKSGDVPQRAFFDERISPQFSSSAQVRYLWRQVFEGCTYDYETRQCEK